MKFVPIGNRVFIRPTKAAEVSKGGIFIPASARDDHEEAAEGEVVYVGPGRELEGGVILPPEVEPGQKVIFNRRMSMEYPILGERLMLTSADEVMAVIAEPLSINDQPTAPSLP